jgi:hypothetical protein
MNWGRNRYYARPPRPKVLALTAVKRDEIVANLSSEIAASPILSAFGVQTRALRNRFYLEWCWDPEVQPRVKSTHGRITPVGAGTSQLLLEVQHGRNQWSRVETDSPKGIIDLIAGDKMGTFHGLGALDDSLRKIGEADSKRLPVTQLERGKFVYSESGKSCSVSEVLYHHFQLPIHIIAQPSAWYSYHRTPDIVESSQDRTRVLVRFTAESFSGEFFGGTCLYIYRNGRWAACPIRPNQSRDIASAEAWLAKRNWVPWS